MLSFLKKKHSQDEIKRTGKESTFSTDDVFEESTGDKSGTSSVETTLSLHPKWKLTKEELYVYQFLNNDCLPLKQNQFAITGIEWEAEENNMVRVSAFFRNSSTKFVNLGERTIVFLNKDDKPIIKQKVNLSELGDIPPKSSRPWHLLLPINDKVKRKLSKEGWSLAFEIQKFSNKHSLDLPPEIEKSLIKEDKESLIKLVQQLRPLRKNEVNLFGVDAMQDSQGKIHVFVLFRNGSEDFIKIDRIPLMFKDASQQVIASGDFRLANFSVKPNSSKAWRFSFPKTLKKTADLSTWEITTQN